MINVSKAFQTSSVVLAEFYAPQGRAYYIPEYQRGYSWSEENVDQLIDDIIRGVQLLVESPGNSSKLITFLGTVIIVPDVRPNLSIPRFDVTARPSITYGIIDGQQRMSTLTLLAIALINKINQIVLPSVDTDADPDLLEAVDSQVSKLQEMVSTSFGKQGYTPERKPKLIRAGVDRWTKDGPDEGSYESDLAHFVAQVLRNPTMNASKMQPRKKTLVAANHRRIVQRLDQILSGNQDSDEEYPSAAAILAHIPELDLWKYDRPWLVERIRQAESEPLQRLVQLLAFAHYLSDRCCLTVIEPNDESWAFDMFQSLNATGTPLTALETFKPLVVERTKKEDGEYYDTLTATMYEEIDDLFSKYRSAATKSRATNEYLTTFALAHNGYKLSSQFSEQRRWLRDEYLLMADDSAERIEFIKRMRDVAVYLRASLSEKPSLTRLFGADSNLSESDQNRIRLCLSYLKQANHRMAHSVLSRYHSQVTRQQHGADLEFAQATQAVVAFFTLWRAALPNSGLDVTYRRVLQQALAWEKSTGPITAVTLKDHLRGALISHEIGSLHDWLPRAKENLRYDRSQTVVKFSLHVTAHDTEADLQIPGLMTVSKKNSCDYLSYQQWVSDALDTVEHVAPINGNAWPAELREENLHHRIGNLTLLPRGVNTSISNRGWIEKWFYYQYLSKTRQLDGIALAQAAASIGVELDRKSLELLRSAPYARHIDSIAHLGPDGRWDRKLVERRTERICTILWDRMWAWLN
jgi:hypothetical protein